MLDSFQTDVQASPTDVSFVFNNVVLCILLLNNIFLNSDFFSPLSFSAIDLAEFEFPFSHNIMIFQVFEATLAQRKNH